MRFGRWWNGAIGICVKVAGTFGHYLREASIDFALYL
jgi:hypothetical protein